MPYSNPITQNELQDLALHNPLHPRDGSPAEQYMPQAYFLVPPATQAGPVKWRLFDAAYITTGIIDPNRLGTGATGAGNLYLADDGTWKPVGGGGGGGDMYKATYDVDNDGTVDSAERIEIIVRNSTGTTLTKGTVVYLSGATGNRPNAVRAQANSETTSSKTFGIVVADINDNSDGYVACNGTLHDLDTSAFADGAAVWLSATTAGAYTSTIPAEPNHTVFIGYVARSHPTQGRLVILIQNGYELNELHGVLISSEANNDLLTYESSTGLWKNKTISTIFGGTPLTSVPTLAQVTTAGNTTTNAIIINGNTITPNGSGHKVVLSAGSDAITRMYFDSTATGANWNAGISISASSVPKWTIAGYGSTYDFTFYNEGLNLPGLFIKGSNNNVIIGASTWNPTDAGFKLDVNGTARVQGNLTVDTNTLFVDAANDRVGIGTITPSAKVDINLGAGDITNSVYIRNSSSTGYSSVTMFDDRNTTSYIGQWGIYGSGVASPNTSNMFFYNTAGGGIGFYVGTGAVPTNDLRLLIKSSGNVLIGTNTDTGHKLRVQGTVSAVLTNATQSDVVYYNTTTGELTYGALPTPATPTLDAVTSAGNTTTNAINTGLITSTTTSAGNMFVANGINSTSLVTGNDSSGRVFINVSGSQVGGGAYTGGAYFTATGYQEAWFSMFANSATANNRWWRMGHQGVGGFPNKFIIQKLNDAGTSALNALAIDSTSGNIGINTTTDAGYKLDVNGTMRIQGATFDFINTAAVFKLGYNTTKFTTFEAYPDGATRIAVNGVTKFFIGASAASGIEIPYLYSIAFVNPGLATYSHINWSVANSQFELKNELKTAFVDIAANTIKSSTGVFQPLASSNITVDSYTLSRAVSTFGLNTIGNALVVNDIDGAKWILLTGGYDLTFAKHISSTGIYRSSLVLEGDGATNDPQGFTAYTGTTAKLKLMPSGNLLIQNGGTFTDAGYTLDVAGTARVQNNLLVNGPSTFTGRIYLGDSGADTDTNYYIQSGGQVYIQANAFRANNFYTDLVLMSGTTSVSQIQIRGNDDSSGFIRFTVNNTEAARFFNNGDLAIGTTSDDGYKLNVNGVIAATGGTSTNWNTAYSWGNHATAGYLTSQPWVTSGSNIYYNTGNVGIGTTNPTLGKLHVEGTVYSTRFELALGADLASGDKGIRVQDAFGNMYQYNNSGPYVGHFTAYHIRNTSAATMFYATSSAFGIGTTSPTARVHITGGSANWNEATPGTATGTIHLDPETANNDFGNAITFGASDWDNGNNAQAGIYVRSDGNYGTKMYFATTDAYLSGSKTRMFIGHDGNVGIGTTTPTYTLDVNGSIRGNSNLYITSFDANDGIFADDGFGSTMFSISRRSSNEIRFHSYGFTTFYTSGNTGTEKMRITEAGNVGIGTTSPTQQLHVTGKVLIGAVDNYGDAHTKLYIHSPTNAVNIVLNPRPTAGDIYYRVKLGVDAYSNGSFYVEHEGVGRIIEAWNSGGYLNLSSVVSLGNKAWTLETNGYGLQMYSPYGWSSVVRYTNAATGTTATDGALTGITENGDFRVWTYESHPMLFATANAERMRITNTGDVGIGTITPTDKLSVVGTVAATGYKINGNAGWSGTIFIPSNPPGQQNITVEGGLITNFGA